MNSENQPTPANDRSKIRCRWCKKTKPANEMSLIGFASGVCDKCMNAPNAEELHAKYLMEGMGAE